MKKKIHSTWKRDKDWIKYDLTPKFKLKRYTLPVFDEIDLSESFQIQWDKKGRYGKTYKGKIMSLSLSIKIPREIGEQILFNKDIKGFLKIVKHSLKHS